MASIAKNNAFGAGAPSWNLPFPFGALTAAEIVTYGPHWLKSVDVIDRFLSHGARTSVIAALINEFRIFPHERIFTPNSTLVMMSYAMRKAGYDGWCVMKHFEYPREFLRPEDDLNVAYFRTPRITHPKGVKSSDPNYVLHNQDSPPIPFKDLALHVKKHPSGDDALDLTRCVLYAVEHEDEVWMFPTDFQRLIAHLGGPATVTHAHLDRQVFARRNHVKFSNPKPSRRKNTVKQEPRTKQITIGRVFINTTMANPNLPQQLKTEKLGRVVLGTKRRSGRLASKKINFAEEPDIDQLDNFISESSTKKRKLSRSVVASRSFADDEFVADETEADDDIPEEDFGEFEQDELPRSEVHSRVAVRKARASKKPAFGHFPAAPQLDLAHDYHNRQFDFAPSYGRRQLNFSRSYDYPEPSFVPSSFSHQSSSFAPSYGTPQYSFGSNSFDSHQFDFAPSQVSQQSNFKDDYDFPEPDFGSLPVPQDVVPADPAESYVQLFAQPYTGAPVSEEAMHNARLHYARNPPPIMLPVPMLPANRPRITEQNIHQYALAPFHSRQDMFLTAFHYMRFGGARLSAPYRELHNLDGMGPGDTSDWAENIRWAKEQWINFGSVWTESEYHLNCISAHRLENCWRSKEALASDSKMFAVRL